jgi:hypothetical protein
VLYSMFLHLRFKRKKEGVVKFNKTYMAFFLTSFIVFLYDPLFNQLVGQSGLLTQPLLELDSFLSALYNGGTLSNYQEGYSTLGRIGFLIPLISLFIIETWIFVRTDLISIIRGEVPSKERLLGGAMFLTFIALMAGSVFSSGGLLRTPEANYALIFALPLMLRHPLDRKRWRFPGSVISLMCVTLVIIIFTSFLTLYDQPIDSLTIVKAEDMQGATYLTHYVGAKIWTDAWEAGLIYRINPSANLLQFGDSNLISLGKQLYTPDGFSNLIRSEGAMFAYLRNVDFGNGNTYSGLILPDFIVKPVWLNLSMYSVVYGNGETWLIAT